MSIEDPTHQWAEHAAAKNTHNRTLQLVQQYLPKLAGLKILDLPSGAGLLSKHLAELGADATPMDIELVEPFHADRSKLVLGDANLKLPFPDGHFDAVVTIEGIEHLENPSFFLRECARVTRPGGWVFLSTPNVDSFRSRKSVFLHGFHKFFGPWGDTHKNSWHLLPIDMIFFRGAAQKAGLDIVEVTVNDTGSKNLFKELVRPLMVKKLPQYLRDPALFYGEVVIYAMRKPN